MIALNYCLGNFHLFLENLLVFKVLIYLSTSFAQFATLLLIGIVII